MQQCAVHAVCCLLGCTSAAFSSDSGVTSCVGLKLTLLQQSTLVAAVLQLPVVV